MSRYAQIAYTPSVRRVQERMGSAQAAARRLHGPSGRRDPLTDAEAAFIRSMDGFLIATVGETGWPYMQFRGGPPGFVHVLDERTLGYADVRGNRQYITAGNLSADDRVSLFFIHHAEQARLKVFGRARVAPAPGQDPGEDPGEAPGQNPGEDPGQGGDPDEDPDPRTRTLTSVRTEGRVERFVLIDVEGFDWNCHQHITRRFSERELSTVLGPIDDRLEQLEAENAALRAEIDALRGR